MKKKYSIALVFIFFVFSFISCGSSDEVQTKNTLPEKIVEKYLKCETWEERLSYVRKSEDVKEVMATHYNNIELTPIKGKLNYEKYESDNNDIVAIKTDSLGYDSMYFLIKENDEYKIDWEASLLKNDMSWSEFKATKPKIPTKFRVAVALDDYYNYEFSDLEDQCWSIDLSEITYDSITGTNITGLNGYIEKNSEDGEKLFELLKDGKEHSVILELSYPENNESSSNCVLIDNLVSTSLIEY